MKPFFKRLFKRWKIALITLLSVFTCLSHATDTHSIDFNLVGTFEGNMDEDGMCPPFPINWKVQRNSNNTFEIDFFRNETNEYIGSTQGLWYTKDNVLYIKEDDIDEIVTYKYELLNQNTIEFTQLEESQYYKEATGCPKDPPFIDYRILNAGSI